jgi:hypothetical protein
MNLPFYPLQTRKRGNTATVFDPVRQKWVTLTPEEHVRQNLVQHLVATLGYPQSLLAVEKSINVNGIAKRCDIVVYDTNHRPLVLVECKSPQTSLTQKTFDQAAAYNVSLGVSYFLLYNGLHTCFCEVDFMNKTYKYLDSIPRYDLLHTISP